MSRVPRGLVGRLGAELLLALVVGLTVGLLVVPRSYVVIAPYPPTSGGRVVEPSLLPILVLGLATAVLLGTPALYGVVDLRRGPGAVRLPGFTGLPPAPAPGLVRLGAAVIAALVLLLAIADQAVVAGVLAVVGAAFGLGLLASSVRRRRMVGSVRSGLGAALAAYRPEFVVYTARRNDASYQLRMWLPELEKLGRRYVVVVRHPEAVGWAAATTSAPVVCAPAVADLDAIAGAPDGSPVVPSLRATFYVNGVSENVQFVNYRGLRHVYLGHGDSDKELSAHPMHAMFDRVFVAGPAAIARYGPARVEIPASRFVVVGRPQLAGLAGVGERPTGRARRVLIAPTWRGYNAKTRLGSLGSAAALARLLIGDGAEVVFRPHPFSWQGGDRRLIEEVDALLTADARASGREHVTAARTRDWTTDQTFDAVDAMITDVGSMLVDFFATGKPYAVVLPFGVSADALVDRYPSTAAAYPVDPADLTPGVGWLAALDPDAADSADSVDPLRAARAALTLGYLGEHPRDDRPFLTAAAAELA